MLRHQETSSHFSSCSTWLSMCFMLFFSGARTLNWQCVTGQGTWFGIRNHMNSTYIFCPPSPHVYGSRCPAAKFWAQRFIWIKWFEWSTCLTKGKGGPFLFSNSGTSQGPSQASISCEYSGWIVKARSFTSFCLQHMTCSGSMCLCPHCHSWGFFIWKSVFISANRLLHVDMKINSSVDLGLLDFPEVRMSLPNVAIPPRSCFCVHSWRLLMANSHVITLGAWLSRLSHLYHVKCECGPINLVW